MIRPARHDRVRAWYDAHAARYDRDHPGIPGDTAFYAGLAAGRGVLELGAGTGRVTAACAAVARSVVALDSSPAMLRLAAARLKLMPNVALVCADMRRPPLRRGYDLVLAAYRTVQHPPDAAARREAFHAVAGSLAPSGVLAFDTWHGPTSPDQAPFLAPVTEDGIAADLASAGLAIEAMLHGFSPDGGAEGSFNRIWLARRP